MNFLRKSGIIIGVLAILAACDKETPRQAADAKVIAIAGDEQLTSADFRTGIAASLADADSASRAKRFLEKWAIESLFYQEAISKLNEEEVQIEKQVQEYRQSLVNHLYETKVIEANLDTVVSMEEIEQYYNDHRDNFILKDNIVKVYYLKIAEKSPALPKIKKLLVANDPKEKEQLINLLSENAENFYLNDSTWLMVDDIKKEIPALRDQEGYSFVPGRVLEFTDDFFYYYLKVKDVMTKNSYSPLNFERNNIRKFIINNRKTQLILNYKQLLLETATNSKKFVIYK